MRRLAMLALSLMTITANGATVEERRAAFEALLDSHWEYRLSQSPEFASIIGDRRWNDQLTDLSLKAIDRRQVKAKEFLQKFQAIASTGFPDQERLSQALIVTDLQNEIEEHQFRPWEMPVSQIGGLHLDAANLIPLLPFTTVKDYDDYIRRLQLLPRLFNQTTRHMRSGMKRGAIPPAFLLAKVAAQAEDLGNDAPEKSPFAQPLAKLPDSFSAAEKKRIREETLQGITKKVLPAYKTFATFVKKEYSPRGRTDVGIWSIPRGDDYYRFLARLSTTTNLTPEEIHETGLREVSRIEREMLEIAKKLGFDDLKSFNVAIENNPALRPKSREHILEQYRTYNDQMYRKLPQLFGRLPKAKLVVLPVEEFMEDGAPAASYEQGTPDGSRPGQIRVNTGDFANRKLISNESTAYHEGVPGHHMQIAIAQELQTLPPFRQQAHHTAFIEGWALYSERLGKEVGFYQDPYSDYGRLQDEMLRAIRLVVDTGLHTKKWKREDVVKFFHDHSGLDEVDLQAETDRYIVWPGQALGYKIGQMKIVELRERAKKELGDKFDIRHFHDEVLGAGSLPMNLLEERIEQWIRRTLAAGDSS